MPDDIIVTTGSNIDGYEIKKYHKIVFGKKVVSDLYFYQEKEKSLAFYDEEFEKAESALKEKAGKIGANAVIGVHSDVEKGTGVVVLTLTGTAVTIEKC